MNKKKEIRKKERIFEDKQLIKSLPPLKQRYTLYNKDISQLTEITDNSVDCIITDPPYPHEYLPLIRNLGQLAKRILKDGGSCFVMLGQSYLPECIEMLSESLNYHWILSYLTSGGQATQLWQKNVISFWKPILWFVKGKYERHWIADVSQSEVNDNDKRFHKWGQSESGMTDLILRCSRPADLICDPFCGGGTTVLCALKSNRLVIGNDIDIDMISITTNRINEEITQTKMDLSYLIKK